ncbi:hypothetical protein F5Y00DRAFT_271164 [Daldinia vernicosa]|uniref:uncharacterized protein n=1 Tax=Daldinia vernicosa TaxID=114800 RepID=UPI00200786F3|nr:uncharacterized protein F5Y00DRAFT_271164 [Daldinia vernicosa]KAI0847423.1 hypothetical protein F5Y00DRAFT_271164 [Daldinia vernicosa]
MPCPDAFPFGKPNIASVRTPYSLVWGTTKAVNLVSSVRFSWDNRQNSVFIKFLKAIGPDYKDVDIEPLLFELDLHGYDDIRTKYGESVYSLIKEKVMRKLKRTADKMKEDGLFESDTESSDDSNESSVTLEDIKFTQPKHPFIKMPQREVHKGNPKNATCEDSTSTYMSETSDSSSRAPLASQKSRNIKTTSKEAKYESARQSIRNLVFELFHTEEALIRAASAFSDLPPIEKGDKWTVVLNQMILTLSDIKLDAKKFYEFAKQNL